MTTTVYCTRDINEDGDYKSYNCPKLKEDVYWENICEKCRCFIPEGKEVPAP